MSFIFNSKWVSILVPGYEIIECYETDINIAIFNHYDSACHETLYNEMAS